MVNTRLVSLTTLLQAVAIFFLVVTQVQAGPLSIQKRKTLDVWSPKIIVPNSSTVWQDGAKEFVQWDTSNAPKSISNRGYVTLKFTPPNGDTPQVRKLAGPFNLTDGKVTFTLPNDVATGQFSVILFGDSGNESNQFHINGIPPPKVTPWLEERTLPTHSVVERTPQLALVPE